MGFQLALMRSFVHLMNWMSSCRLAVAPAAWTSCTKALACESFSDEGYAPTSSFSTSPCVMVPAGRCVAGKYKTVLTIGFVGKAVRYSSSIPIPF